MRRYPFYARMIRFGPLCADTCISVVVDFVVFVCVPPTHTTLFCMKMVKYCKF